jgi:hypothetical protein
MSHVLNDLRVSSNGRVESSKNLALELIRLVDEISLGKYGSVQLLGRCQRDHVQVPEKLNCSREQWCWRPGFANLAK